MADSEKANDNRWSLWARTQKTAIEWLAVIISIIGFLLTSLLSMVAVIIAGVSMWVANESHDEAEVLGIYVQKLHADMKAHGFEPPPLPEEK